MFIAFAVVALVHMAIIYLCLGDFGDSRNNREQFAFVGNLSSMSFVLMDVGNLGKLEQYKEASSLEELSNEHNGKGQVSEKASVVEEIPQTPTIEESEKVESTVIQSSDKTNKTVQEPKLIEQSNKEPIKKEKLTGEPDKKLINQEKQVEQTNNKTADYKQNIKTKEQRTEILESKSSSRDEIKKFSLQNNTIEKIDGNASSQYVSEEKGTFDSGLSGSDSSSGKGRSTQTGEVYGTPFDVSRLKIVFRPKFVYPQQARRFGYEGEVVLDLSVSEDGVVSNVTVNKSSGYQILDSSAKSFAKKILFSPESVRALGNKVIVRIPVKYRLRK